jgi:hypothetical protein
MKSLVILSTIFMFLMTGGVTNDFIRIEYEGNSFKPMRILWISKKPLLRSEQIVTVDTDSPGYDCVVNEDEFLFIEKAIDSTTHKLFEEKDHNGFKITIHENDADIYYFITRKNSTSLFLKMSAYLEPREENKKLIYELDVQRKSHVYDDSGNFIGGYEQ